MTAQSAAQPPANPPNQAESVKTTVTVVGKITAETPANVTAVDSLELQQTPGANLDDRLRNIPGFTLFKRASSVVANPTTQGISLRGLGSSGASRTLMLWEGVPVNDPFGGWIYWTQFIPAEMDYIEISRGAATSAFGNLAMSGAITAFTRQPEKLHLLAGYETGNNNTQDASVGFSNAWTRWALSGAVRSFDTDGYYIVPANIRGPVDWRAGVRFVTGDLHIDHDAAIGSFFFKTNILAEDRENGTSLTHNSTGLGTASLHFLHEFARDLLSITAYETREGFHASFSSVAANRQTERLTYLQSVPSDATGGAVLWQHHSLKWNLTGGADADRIQGTDTDHLIPTGQRVGGGVQVERGLFGQGDVEIGPVRLYAGGRETLIGHSNFFAPTAGIAYGHGRLRLRGSVYRSFRAPTLNELYRSFSAGNTFTEANAGLQPETAFGGEVGMDWTGEASSVRLTAYHSSLDNLITNVTLSSASNQIVRQRQNATAAVSRGFEADFRKRYGYFSGSLQYLFVDSRYVNGYRISQVPKHQGTAELAYRRGGTMAAADVRSFDYQFDDDLNQFRLPGFAVLELAAHQRISGALSVEAAVENALNRVFYTAFTPTPNIGQPRLWRVGLKWEGRLW